jgi:hypothetical protein
MGIPLGRGGGIPRHQPKIEAALTPLDWDGNRPAHPSFIGEPKQNEVATAARSLRIILARGGVGPRERAEGEEMRKSSPPLLASKVTP